MFDYKCVGLDIFVICKGMPQLPERVGDFRLESISSRGMTCDRERPFDGLEIEWYTCRYRGEGITDEALKKLLLELEKHVVWEKIQKLWSHQGKDLFSGSYES